MGVFQFVINVNQEKNVSYYAKCKNINKYISVAKCQSKKLNTDDLNIYNIIGGKFGEYQVNEIVNKKIDDKTLCSQLINNDVNCINKYKLNFNKVDYDKAYQKKYKRIEYVFETTQGKKFKTFKDLEDHYKNMMEAVHKNPSEDLNLWKVDKNDCELSSEDWDSDFSNSIGSSSIDSSSEDY